MTLTIFSTKPHLDPLEHWSLELGLLGDEVLLAEVEEVHCGLGCDEWVLVQEIDLLHVPI